MKTISDVIEVELVQLPQFLKIVLRHLGLKKTICLYRRFAAAAEKLLLCKKKTLCWLYEANTKNISRLHRFVNNVSDATISTTTLKGNFILDEIGTGDWCLYKINLLVMS
jgi:hypothetical protein